MSCYPLAPTPSTAPLPDVQPGENCADDYLNPLEASPRWQLLIRAYTLRTAASFAFSFTNLSARGATRVIWLDSTLATPNVGAKIKVDIWDPSPESGFQPRTNRPAIINFHGGGFVIGQGTDDARWAGAAAADLGAVVFSINYRLAPQYPFPTAVEDCADSISQIFSRADEFGIDRDRIVLSGFSAGGTLALASWVLLHSPERWGYQPSALPPRVAGLALFYPLLDWTISRLQKRLSCSRPDLALANNLTDLFDASYVYPPLPKVDRDDPRLSPGLMSNELLECLPPVHLCLCEYDMLLAEGLTFADRLKSKGKRVSVRTVAGERHGWDKAPTLATKENIRVEYGEAVGEIKRWFEIGRDVS